MASFIHGRKGAAEQQSQNALVTICWRDEYSGYGRQCVGRAGSATAPSTGSISSLLSLSMVMILPGLVLL